MPRASTVSENAQPVRVLTVDDQDIFRAAARELVARTPGFETVGEAASGAQALADVDALHPDLVLLDVRMPAMHGVEASRRIHAAHPEVVVVLVSADDLEDLPGDVETCGAVAACASATWRRGCWHACGLRRPPRSGTGWPSRSRERCVPPPETAARRSAS